MGHLMISTGAGSGCLLKTFRANRLIWENQVGSGTVAGISTPFLGGVHHLLQISYQKPLIYDHLPEPEKSVERRNGKEITMNLFLMPELFPTCLGILIQLSPSFLGLLCIILRRAGESHVFSYICFKTPWQHRDTLSFTVLLYLCNFPWIPDTAMDILYPSPSSFHTPLGITGCWPEMLRETPSSLEILRFIPWTEQHQDVANAANASILWPIEMRLPNTSVIENKKTFPIRVW